MINIEIHNIQPPTPQALPVAAANAELFQQKVGQLEAPKQPGQSHSLASLACIPHSFPNTSGAGLSILWTIAMTAHGRVHARSHAR